MKLTIHHQKLRSSHALDSMVEQQIFVLTELIRVDDATVVLQHRPEESPAYRAEVRVAVSGPDLTVEAVDHTIENAFLRAATELETKLRERAFRRDRQVVDHRKHGSNFRTGRRSR